MNTLRLAAMALIHRWDSPAWKDERHTAEFINDLRKALATPSLEDQMKEFESDYCNVFDEAEEDCYFLKSDGYYHASRINDCFRIWQIARWYV